MKSKMPKSHAKTAYGLLSEIKALALEEPRRIRMSHWGGAKGNAKFFSDDMRPACNTVGCIGGWTNVFKPNHTAATVLGLSAAQEDELFYSNLCNDDRQGTLWHAKRVAASIVRFQRKYAAQLKAKRV